jgi:hypothetical protein
MSTDEDTSLDSLAPQELTLPLHAEVAAWIQERVILDDLTEYPSSEEITAHFGMSHAEFVKASFQASLNRALFLRGWDPYELPVGNLQTQKSRKPGIDPLFALAVGLITDVIDKRSKAQKLKAAGISSARFNYLLGKEDHRAYFDKKMKALHSQMAGITSLSLIRNSENGDLQSIKYYNELTGVYRGTDETVMNLMVILGRMMEVLAKHVEPQVLALVADELDRVIDVTPKEIGNG